MTEKQRPTHIWVFDPNRRVYAKPEKGRIWGSIIWREHWRKREVTGETRLSWILEHGDKVRKDSPDVVTSEAEIDEREFINDHAYRIADAVRFVRDAGVLREIAKLVGYIA